MACSLMRRFRRRSENVLNTRISSGGCKRMISRNLSVVLAYKTYVDRQVLYELYGYDALRTRCSRALAHPFVSYEVFTPSNNAMCQRN